MGARHTQSTIEQHALVCEGFILLGLCFGTVTEVTAVRKDNSWGYTFQGSLEQRTETDTLSGRLSRDLTPSAVGSLVETDRVVFGWHKQWSEKLGSDISAAAYRSRYIGGAVTNSNSRYYTIEPRLSWQLAERWVLDAGYRYSRHKYDSAPLAADRNLIYVGVSYAWPKIAISR